MSSIYFVLSELIKSHKQTPQSSVDRRHVPAAMSNNNNNIRAFSWQKAKHPRMEKQLVGTSRDPAQSQAMKARSSYSLDKRTTASIISGMSLMYSLVILCTALKCLRRNKKEKL